jgi:hypothetical protein
MKRLTAWLAGFAGGAAVYRLFRRHPPASVAPAADPAEELKAKLAAARETAGAEEAPAEAGVEARRRSVHDRARAAIDEMQGPDPS